MPTIDELDNNSNGLIELDEIKKSLAPNGFLTKEENIQEFSHTLLEQEIESSDEINQSFNESLTNAINDITTNNLDILHGQNIDLLNLWYKLHVNQNGQEKEKICNYLDGQIKHIAANVNKRIAQNKHGNANYYQSLEIKAIQLYTNFIEGTNISINGNRGKIDSVDPNTNAGLTNIAIYKLELATRKDIMEYRNLLKQPIFENLLNIPNIEAQLNGLSIEDKNIILSDFLGFFLKIKSSGMHYENSVGSDMLEEVLHNLILAIKYKDKTIDELVADEKIYYLQTKGIQDLSDETHLEEFSRIEATIRQYKTPGDYFKEIISSYKNNISTFSQGQIQREAEIRKINNINSLIKKINSMDSLGKDEREKQYREIFNSQYFDSLPEDAKNKIYFELEKDYTDAEISKKYPLIYDKIKAAEKKINEEYKENERIADIISQYNSKENFSMRRATRDEYAKVWPQDANANQKGLQGTLQNYSRNIGSSNRTYNKRNDFVPGKIFTIQVPGCQPITVQIDQQDSIMQLFSKTYTDKLVLYNYKLIESSSTNKGVGSEYDYSRIRTSNEKDIRKLSVSDFALARKNVNGSISLRKMINPSYSEKAAVETINSGSIKKVDTLTTDSLSMLSCKEMDTLREGLDIFTMQNEVNSLISKMNNVKIDWGNIGKNILLSGAMSENPNLNIDFFPTTKGQFTEKDVNEVFTSCVQMQDLCKQMRNNKQSLENLHKKVLEMKGRSDKTTLTNEMENYINVLDKNISTLLAAIKEGGAIDQFCKFALNTKNINKRDGAWSIIEQRFKDNGVQILCAIGCAVAVICAVPSGGASLLAVAALGTVGGMIGSRVGQRANEGLNNISKTTIEVNGKVRTVSYDDPTDVKLLLNGELGALDFAKGLTKEFIIGTISTFGMMKVGQRIGQGLSKSHPKLAQKIRPKVFEDTSSQYTEDVFNSIANNGNQSFLNRFGKEFLEECGEEITETGGDMFSEQTGIPFIGTVFSIYHCLTPGPGSNILNKNNVSFDNFRHNGSNIEIDAYYDGNLQLATDVQTGVQTIIDYYTHNGYEYHPDTQTLTKPNEDIKKYTNVIKLIPTKADITTRNLASSKLGEIGGFSVNHESGEFFYDPSNVKELEIFMVHEKLGSPKIDSNNNMIITLKDGTEIILKPKQSSLNITQDGGESIEWDSLISELEESETKNETRLKSLRKASANVKAWKSQYDSKITEINEKLENTDLDEKTRENLESEKQKYEKIKEILNNPDLLIKKVTLKEKVLMKVREIELKIKKLYEEIKPGETNLQRISEIENEIKSLELKKDEYKNQIKIIDAEITSLIRETYQGIRSLKGLTDNELMAIARTYYENILEPLSPLLKVIDSSASFDSKVVNEDFSTNRQVNIGGIISGDIISYDNLIKLNTMGDVDGFIESLPDESPVKQICLELKESLELNTSDGRLLEADKVIIFENSVRYMCDYMQAYPGIEYNNLYKILDINQNKLMHQHLQDKEYLTGSSHDVLHILRGNMAMAESFMKNMSPKERVITRQIIIDHDMGYTAMFNKLLSGIRSNVFFDATKDHPLWSTIFIEGNADWYIENFGQDGFNVIKDAVTGHSKANTTDLPANNRIVGEKGKLVFDSNIINGVISVVDCAAASADFKSAFLFQQPALASTFLSVYECMNVGKIDEAINNLHKIMDSVNSISDENLKSSLKKALNSFHLISEDGKTMSVMDEKIKTIDDMDDANLQKEKSKELAKLKEKGIDKIKKFIKLYNNANITNEGFRKLTISDETNIDDIISMLDHDITNEGMKNYLKFNYINDIVSFPYEKYLSQYGVRLSSDYEGKPILSSNERGVVYAEFELAGKSFETLVFNGGASFALASFVKVCDDFYIDKKGPEIIKLSNEIDNRKHNAANIGLVEYLKSCDWGDMVKLSESGDVIGIKIIGKNGEEVVLNFEGKSYEGFDNVNDFNDYIRDLSNSINVLNESNIESQTDVVLSTLESLAQQASDNGYMIDGKKGAKYISETISEIKNARRHNNVEKIKILLENAVFAIKQGHYEISGVKLVTHLN